MVKVQDGSMVYASELLGGSAEDDEGNKLKFEQVSAQGATIPTYQAKSEMQDGSGRTKVYSFNIEDTQVRVSVIQQTKQEVQAQQKALQTEKAVKTVEPQQQQQQQQQSKKQQQEEETTTTGKKVELKEKLSTAGRK